MPCYVHHIAAAFSMPSNSLLLLLLLLLQVWHCLSGQLRPRWHLA
jgi:hypothetical protein